MKDYRMWVEIAKRRRKCHCCSKDIAKGIMFIRSGNRSSPRYARSICASCFEEIMNDLSHDFENIRSASECSDPLNIEPICFGCGLKPERCKCGHEAYR
ncbi:MAG: hypothetical protein GX369_03245 [Euryarchaeota archaeon]|nr:hypothetical protein [Euryarchaeota archaeon]